MKQAPNAALHTHVDPESTPQCRACSLSLLTFEAERRPRLDSDTTLLNFPAVVLIIELTSSNFCLFLLTTAEAIVWN